MNEEVKPNQVRPGLRTLLFLFQFSFVAALLAWWLGSESVRQSKNLWVFFFYSFPAEFLISTVPHEPALLYFGKFYSPWTVALVAMVGTALTEVINYSVFGYIADLKVLKRMLEAKSVKKMVALFNKAPFTALWIAGFTPVPFYPFRFMVVIARYPLYKYILAVITSRTPRFFILALAGRAIKFPDYLLAVLMIVLILAANIPIFRKMLQKRRGKKEPPELLPGDLAGEPDPAHGEDVGVEVNSGHVPDAEGQKGEQGFIAMNEDDDLVKTKGKELARELGLPHKESADDHRPGSPNH